MYQKLSHCNQSREHTEEEDKVSAFQKGIRTDLLEQLKRIVDAVRPGVLIKVLHGMMHAVSPSHYPNTGKITNLIERADGRHEDDCGTEARRLS